MPSYWAQFEAARQTNLSIRALDQTVRSRIEQVFVEWDSGQHSAQSVRWALEMVVREAYRSSAAVGLAHLAAQAGIPRWRPRSMVAESMRSAYLDGLLDDVRRNLREYKDSDRGPEARKKAVSRIQFSAGVASSRGHTDALLRAANELSRDYGFLLKKVWRANFLAHTPCELCAGLHGTSVPLGDSFPADSRLKVYGDLKGPPRHPRCMCWLVILIEGVENVDDDPTGASETDVPESMTTDEVKSLPTSFFRRVVGWLRKMVQGLRRNP